VAGNHDYHLLKLQSHQYPFKFLSDWSSPFTVNEIPPDNIIESTKPTLSSSVTSTVAESNTRYIFKHGWEFDLAQQPVIMEALCHNLSDDAGSVRTCAYNALQMFRSQFSKVLNEIIDFHNKKSSEGYLDNLLQPPEQRLQPYLSDVEKKAYSSIQQNEILVFGHTHRPFVSSDRKIANSGSWVKDAPVHNTFVELDMGNIRLFQFVNKSARDITKENIIQITS